MVKKKPLDLDYELDFWSQYVGREVIVVHTIQSDSFQKGVGNHEDISKGIIVSVYRELGKRNNAVIIWYTDHKSFMRNFYPQTTKDELHFEIV